MLSLGLLEWVRIASQPNALGYGQSVAVSPSVWRQPTCLQGVVIHS